MSLDNLLLFGGESESRAKEIEWNIGNSKRGFIVKQSLDTYRVLCRYYEHDSLYLKGSGLKLERLVLDEVMNEDFQDLELMPTREFVELPEWEREDLNWLRMRVKEGSKYLPFIDETSLRRGLSSYGRIADFMSDGYHQVLVKNNGSLKEVDIGRYFTSEIEFIRKGSQDWDEGKAFI